MTIVEWKKKETVAVIQMNTSENRQNLKFADAMNATLEAVVADLSVTAAVITSTSEKYWSLGVDVEWLGRQLQDQNLQAVKGFLYGMNAVFKKLLLLPIPVIAAINGHAFGNGAILACACDFRFMRADRGYFCFPEVDLGIPFLPGMIAFVKKAIPYYKFNEMKLTGRRVAAAELEAAHVIEKACPDADQLTAETIAFAKTFQKKRGIFAEHKKRLHKQILAAIDTEDPEFIESLFLMVQD
jgi:enoyl-CoA hydratase/carnithine racemase